MFIAKNSSLLHPPDLYRKAEKSIPSFVVVLVLSVACGFLCLIPIGFYSKQINVKPCSKCLHQVFNLFHPFRWVALHWFLKSATKVQLLNCQSFKICEFHQKDFQSSAVSHLHCLKWQRCIKTCLISRGRSATGWDKQSFPTTASWSKVLIYFGKMSWVGELPTSSSVWLHTNLGYIFCKNGSSEIQINKISLVAYLEKQCVKDKCILKYVV